MAPSESPGLARCSLDACDREAVAFITALGDTEGVAVGDLLCELDRQHAKHYGAQVLYVTWRVTVPGNEDHRLVVSLDFPDGSIVGEFSVQWLDHYDGIPHPRLECWDDGWKTLHMSGLTEHMANWPEDISLDDMLAALVALGYDLDDRRVRSAADA